MLSCLSARRGWLARLTFVQDVVEGPLLTWRAQGTEPNPRPMRACTGARCRVPRHHTSDHLVLPGFKWSSQHLERGGCDDCSEAAFGSVRARRVALAWPTLCCTAGASPCLLGCHRGGMLE